MIEHDIIDGHLIVTQEKTKQPSRIQIVAQLEELLGRIKARKAGHNLRTAALLVNEHGKRLISGTLPRHFDAARDGAAEEPRSGVDIKASWFYYLRAKAADDTSDDRDDQAAGDLLGHDSVKTTQRHYLQRGKIVAPTK